MTKKVAILVSDLRAVGDNGVASVAHFIYRILENSDEYSPELISLATSFKDRASLRLLAPKTWFSYPRILNEVWNNIPFKHIGASFVEFEFQRFFPRSILTKTLKAYDLIIVIAGIPAWAYIANKVYSHRPVALQVATLAKIERRKRIENLTGFYGAWYRVMTSITSRLDMLALKHVDKVFVENRWMFDLVGDISGQSKVVLAPPGIDSDRFCPPVSKGYDRYILSVGRFIDPRKDVALLFKAYYRLRELYPDTPRLVLAGKSAPSQANWDLAESLNIRPFIEFISNPTQAELIKIYQNATVFVLSSDEEGLGVVILEAMACALPIVSTKCGGPEILVSEGVNGFFAPVGDDYAMALRLQEILTNPILLEKFGVESRRIILEQFSLDKASQKFFRGFEELLK